MKLIFYATETHDSGARLQTMIETKVPNENIEVHRTIDSLNLRLRQLKLNNSYDLSIAVILAGRKEDLFDILSIRKLLRDIRIILILPDRDENTIAMGHHLRPRLLSYADSDFSEVVAVLAKMRGKGRD